MPSKFKSNLGMGRCLVRIEYRSTDDSAVRIAEFEDSGQDDQEFCSKPGWCLRWALGMLRDGDTRWVAEDLCMALSECEADFEEIYQRYESFKKLGFDKDDQMEELRLLESVLDAARKWKEKQEANADKLRAEMEASDAN